MFRRCCVSWFAAAVVLAASCRSAAGEDLPTVTIEGVQAPDQAVGSSCENCCGCDCGPTWVAYSDAMFLHRSTPHDRVLVTDAFGPSGKSLLNANELDLGTSAGWDVSVMRRNILGSQWSLEGVYFGLDDWDATRGVEQSAAGAVTRFVTPMGNVHFPVDISAWYRSALHDVELNAWRPVGAWGSLLIGFRYLDLGENGLNMYNTILASPPNPAVVRVDADNYLSGFQIGFDSPLWSRNRLSLEGCAKAGVYENHATNAVLITQDGPSYESSAKTDHVAFVGNLALTGKYAITTSLSVRAGYQVFWIDGVALAPDQIAVSDPGHGRATVATSGSPFYHGAFVGLELQR